MEKNITLRVKNLFPNDCSELEFSLPASFTIGEVKNLICTHHSSHPNIMHQQLICQGQVRRDEESLEQLRHKEEMMIVAYLLSITSMNEEALSETQGKSLQADEEKNQIVFDQLSIESARQWLSKPVNFDHNQFSFIQQVAASLPNDVSRNNVITMAEPLPPLINFRVLAKLALGIVLFGQGMDKFTLFAVSIIYYLYSAGFISYVFRKFFAVPPNLIQNHQILGGNQQNPPLLGAPQPNVQIIPNAPFHVRLLAFAQNVAGLTIPIPRSQGLIYDIVTLIGSFFLSLFPSWNIV